MTRTSRRRRVEATISTPITTRPNGPRNSEHDNEREPAPETSFMSKERLYLFDTTLRDGAQTNGVDFTLDDKILVAKMLDRLGVDYVEGGYPGANPTDDAFFSEKRTERAA